MYLYACNVTQTIRITIVTIGVSGYHPMYTESERRNGFLTRNEFTSIPFRKKFLYRNHQNHGRNGIEMISDQRNVMSIAGYVDPAIVS